MAFSGIIEAPYARVVETNAGVSAASARMLVVASSLAVSSASSRSSRRARSDCHATRVVRSSASTTLRVVPYEAMSGWS